MLTPGQAAQRAVTQGGSCLRRSRRPRTILKWMATLTQYYTFRYIC